ncbi:MAG: kinase [Lactobacillus sp.]|nr:kinase [Lactobacillus sp.]
MKKLIMFRGNSGSGKSTLAREIHKKLARNNLLISQDTIRRDMLRAKDGKDTTALPLLENLLEYGHNNCEITILEGILNAEWYTPLFRKAQYLYGQNINAYYFDIPFRETVKRHKTRPQRGSFSSEKMKTWWNEKDYIRFIKERSFTSEMTLDDEIQIVIEDLKKDLLS